MSVAVGVVDPGQVDLLARYDRFVAALQLSTSQRQARRQAARRFVAQHPDLAGWMARPTPTRLRDLHHHRAWPFLSWCLVEGHLRADLELLLAKPHGCGLTQTWCARHREDVDRVAEVGRLLDWSHNWSRQVTVLCLPILCLWAAKPLEDIHDGDFDAILAELDQAADVSVSARQAARRRLFSLSQACYQLELLERPRRRAGPVARTPAERADNIAQPEIRREVVRYARTLSATLKPGSVAGRISSLMVFFGWLAEHHPEVARLDQLERDHIEPFLVWERTRPWRGANPAGRTISVDRAHHDVIALRVFFDDIAEWGWACQPPRRLLFASDIPKLPDPLPRALPPDIDRALMAAVDQLDDLLVRTGLLMLRSSGMRIGELLDLELDCVVDLGRHGSWLRVPLGKLDNERMVPLDDDTVAVLDGWLDQRGPQRAIPHPRDSRRADFLFLEGGRRPSPQRLRRGLRRAAAAAGLHGADGTPLVVVPHQLRHSYGTELVNGGISLPALMALLGHVTPEMTLRYAKLANPTIRAAYQDAIDKTRVGRALPIATVNRNVVVPDRVAWLRAEMLKTRLAHGFCAREPAAGPCAYANICEQCDNFGSTPELAPVIHAQLVDIRALRDDAGQRGWTDEAARHQQVIVALEDHLQRLTASR